MSRRLTVRRSWTGQVIDTTIVLFTIAIRLLFSVISFVVPASIPPRPRQWIRCFGHHHASLWFPFRSYRCLP